jgi:2'-5' RNA ligase
MANLCIVAIPATDDDIWQESSEQVPHLTFMFLGDADSNPNFDEICESVQKYTSRMEPFSLRVDHRGTLGRDEADVLFFSDDIPYPVLDFRSMLMGDVNIRSAYNSQQQYTEWSPHLTLGYPDTPAKEYNLDEGEVDYITFDKIAVWNDNYAGKSFPLIVGADDKPYGSDLAVPDAAWSATMKDVLEHHGVKGMRWGVRGGVGSPRAASTKVTVTQKGKKKLKATGGEGHPAHKEAIVAKSLGQQAKKSGHQSLSNEELQAYAKRLNLEQNVKRLEQQNKAAPRRFISGILKGQGNQQANNLANTAITKTGKAAIAAAL